VKELLEKLMDLPHATIIADVIVVLAVVAYLKGTVTFEEAVLAVSAGTAGAGVLGHARNGAGRGVKR
jgi:hypothetical protein